MSQYNRLIEEAMIGYLKQIEIRISVSSSCPCCENTYSQCYCGQQGGSHD